MAAKTVTIHEAKTNLSKLIREVCAGKDIIIARGAEPVVRLVAVKAHKARPNGKRPLGLLKGQFAVGPEFFEPLPEDELEAWGQ